MQKGKSKQNDTLQVRKMILHNPHGEKCGKILVEPKELIRIAKERLE